MTLNSYRELLEIAASKFRFTTFRSPQLNEGEVIWRHDVDFSLLSALELAKIDAEYGSQSTFFLRFRAETYNVFESKNLELVEEIRDLGHDIGLHFEPSDENLTDESVLAEALDVARNQLVAGGIAAPVKSFSFHNTTPQSLQYKNREYGDLVNAYATQFMIPGRYSSDSGGYWRFAPIKDFLQSPDVDRAQVLTHPEWWLETDMPPLSKIGEAAQRQASQAMSKYQEDLTRFGLPLHKGLIEELEEYAEEVGEAIPEEISNLWLAQNLDPLFAWLLCESYLVGDGITNFVLFLRTEGVASALEAKAVHALEECLESQHPQAALYGLFQHSTPVAQEAVCLLLAKYVTNKLSK